MPNGLIQPAVHICLIRQQQLGIHPFAKSSFIVYLYFADNGKEPFFPGNHFPGKKGLDEKVAKTNLILYVYYLTIPIV
jgi:hypothetical protein